MNWFTKWWRRLGSDGDQQPPPQPLSPSWRDGGGERDIQAVVDPIITAGTSVFFDAVTFSDSGGSSFTGGGSFGGGGSSGSW